MNEFFGAMGFRNLDPAQTATLEELATETILNNCLVYLQSILNPSQVAEIKTLLAAEQYPELDARLNEWLQTDFQAVIDQETAAYQEDMLGVANAMTEGTDD